MSHLNKQIKEFIEEFFIVYFTERDFDKLKTFFSSDMTVIGPRLYDFGGTPEDSLQLYKNDLNEITTPIDYNLEKVKITYTSNNISTLIGVMNVKGDIEGQLFTIPDLRYTMTLIKDNKSWKLLQFHISTPNDQREKGELYPLQKISRLNKILGDIVDERTKEVKITNEKLMNSNHTKDTLLSIISHDLRSPFNSLLGFIEILNAEYENLDPKSHKKYVDIIHESANKVYGVLNDLLIWSNYQRNGFEFSPTSINLKKLLGETTALFKEQFDKKQIAISNEVEESIIVLADKFMLSTILRNLLSNSIKYTPINGKVTIGVIFDNNEYHTEVTVCVQDTGVGMTQDKANSLFETGLNPSTMGTNSEMGTGIGLTLCKEFIDLHQTKIWVESTPDVGSNFYFNLKQF